MSSSPRKRPFLLRFLPIVLLLGLILFLVFRNFGGAPKKKEGGGFGGNPIPTVRIAEAEIGSIAEEAEFPGTVRPLRSYVVGARVAGRLTDLAPRIGDEVKKGTRVGTIDPTEWRQAASEAEALFQAAEAALTDAEGVLIHVEKRHARTQALAEEGIATAAEADAAESELISARSRLQQAQAQQEQRKWALAQARTRLQYTDLIAEQAGTVAIRHIEPGGLVTVNNDLLTLVSIDTVRVEITIPTRIFSRISTGEQALVTGPGLPGEGLPARLTQLGSLFDDLSRTTTAELLVPNPDRFLRPGMPVTAALLLQPLDSAQLIPVSAVRQIKDSSYIFTIVDHTAHRIAVETGAAQEGKIHIIRPLITQPFATIGLHLLKEGQTVKIEGEGSSR